MVKVHFGEMSTGVYRNGPCRIIYLYIIQWKWIYMLSGFYFLNHILPMVKWISVSYSCGVPTLHDPILETCTLIDDQYLRVGAFKLLLIW